MDANQSLSEQQRKNFQERLDAAMNKQLPNDWTIIKKIDPERLKEYSKKQDQDNEMVMKQIQPDIFFDQSRKHCILVIMWWAEIRWAVERMYISKIPTRHRESALMDATNMFGEAYLKRKQKLEAAGHDVTITFTTEQIEERIWDFHERCKALERDKIVVPSSAYKLILPWM